jgi:radical SAM superfamily enzyme YgiQ (UPF0313 family)
LWLRPTALLLIGAVLRDCGVGVSLVDCLDRSHPSQAAAYPRTRADGTGKFLKTVIGKPEALGFVPRVYSRYGIPAEAFDGEIRRAPEPDIVLATSSMTYWYPGVVEAIRRIREQIPGAPVVLGGRYATLCPEHARAASGADIVYEGEFDSRFTKLFADLTGYEVGIPDGFAALPAPAHDLRRDRYAAVVGLSRGCPYRCTYCISHALSPRFEQREPECVTNEIAWLAEELGTRHIAFCDDALLVNHDRLLAPVLKAVIDRKYEVAFHTPNAVHAGLLNEEIAELMFRAGFSRIILGYESADPVFQKATGGKVTSEQFGRSVKILRAAGFGHGRIGAYIIMGHPAQTEEDVGSALRSAAELGVEPIPAEFSPIPGTEDYKSAVATFKRPPDADPLLHNSSIIAYQHPNITADGFRRLKDESTEIKREIRKN